MKSGNMPTYKYRANKTGLPTITTYCITRARLFNTSYFRAKEPGFEGNYISVCTEPETSKFIVTNRKALPSENISNNLIVMDLLDVRGMTYLDYVEVVFGQTGVIVSHYKKPNFDGAGNLVSRNTYKLQNTIQLPVVTFKINAMKSAFQVGDMFTISPRVQSYNLTESTMLVEEYYVNGWDIPLLRSAVNARSREDGWIEMKPRGSDKQDMERATTETVLSDFPDMFLTGGSGLPEYPMGENTGTIRSVLLVTYGERDNGTMGEVGIMYEWEGENANLGRWVKLHE